MKFCKGSLATTVFFLLFTLAACGSGVPSPDGTASEAAPTKTMAQQCLFKGDLGCARKNYCGLKEDKGAAFRCCLSQFLGNYFSQNTQELGGMLGYSPVDFAKLRTLSREEILKTKALPFGEWILSNDSDAKALLAQYGMALVNGHVSTQDLRQHLAKFGADLQTTSSCLAGVADGFSEDQLEKEVFASETAQAVASRDLRFLQFLTGTLGYSFQTLGAYESGFDVFPSLPLSQDFLDDLNGHRGEGDLRLGDLSDIEAQAIADKFYLLKNSFEALKAFSELKDKPGRIDDYLNWRFSETKQQDFSAVLKAAYLSLQQAEWLAIPDSDWELRLSALAKAETLPDGRRVDRKPDLLSRDKQGEIQVDQDLVKAWLSPVLRPAEAK